MGQVESSWGEIDRRLRQIAKRRTALDVEEAEWLVRAERARVHVHKDCGSFCEYMEQVLGYAPKTAIDRLKVARAVTEHAALREAMSNGMPFSAVRELVRVVTAGTVENWVARCQGKSLREIEKLVSGHKRGDQPDDPTGPQSQVLRLELAPETMALFREAQRELAGELGHEVDDDAVVSQLCRAFLNGGSGASKKPPYQISIMTCDQCQKTFQDGGGVTVEVSPAVRDAARCDSAHVGRLDAAAPSKPTVEIPAAVRSHAWRRDHGRCRVPGCRAKRHLELHHIRHREHGGGHDAENLVLICSGHHAAHQAGRLAISGSGTQPRFTFLDDPMPDPPKTVDDDVRGALVHMGFKPHEARVATESGRAHVGPHPSVQELLWAALKAAPKPR